MNLDVSLFGWLNFDGGPVLDTMFYGISSRWAAIPLYLFLLWQLWKKFAKQFPARLLTIVLLIALSDQLSVAVKNSVKRLRPCHTPELQASIHLVHGECGGNYGYYSSHASNTAALATLCGIWFAHPLLWRVLWIWVLLVGYSRIYLGAHFPSDILSGWLAGAGLGWIIHVLWTRISAQFAR